MLVIFLLNGLLDDYLLIKTQALNDIMKLTVESLITTLDNMAASHTVTPASEPTSVTTFSVKPSSTKGGKIPSIANLEVGPGEYDLCNHLEHEGRNHHCNINCRLQIEEQMASNHCSKGMSRQAHSVSTSGTLSMDEKAR
ncbi:hypothetical protein CROQUDRAFT_91831 [Cronartium quercuum f. sp. fusiforme G11]|uniref:Uncharacterized protein n=1 Tax=Cronartium quercuum f. sp. fusiforme G11 TaxID=708437 RepID=A0A9P6NN08_9BASI|nr:hypothetical protein CROQUDRAFT_91831 [Cronartium quercuum f. sp. fusiforme G11]